MTALNNGGDSPIWLWWWISSERICTPIGLCAFFLKARIAFRLSALVSWTHLNESAGNGEQTCFRGVSPLSRLRKPSGKLWFLQKQPGLDRRPTVQCKAEQNEMFNILVNDTSVRHCQHSILRLSKAFATTKGWCGYPISTIHSSSLATCINPTIPSSYLLLGNPSTLPGIIPVDPWDFSNKGMKWHEGSPTWNHRLLH